MLLYIALVILLWIPEELQTITRRRGSFYSGNKAATPPGSLGTRPGSDQKHFDALQGFLRALNNRRYKTPLFNFRRVLVPSGRLKTAYKPNTTAQADIKTDLFLTFYPTTQ